MADPLGSVERIIKVGLAIKDAVKTVRKNKEECRDITNHVTRVSALLKRLQESTAMLEDPAMREALEALEETLTRTYELVLACQKKNIMCRFCSAGDLSKQLREMKQDISDQLVDGIFAANVNATIILTNIQYSVCHLPSKDAGVVEISHSNSLNDFARSEEMNDKENNVLAVSKSPSAPFLCLTKFTFSELEASTNKFSDENLIRRGGFGSVYKGVLHDGVVVAIKKFRNSVVLSWDHMYDEINLVSKLQHKNVVKFLGYAQQVIHTVIRVEERNVQTERDCFLVQEYMPNGNLEEHIYGSGLDWCSRFRIIQGIAQGLYYLHEQRVVHSDLKPSNILLDSDMNPKISDFGIARMLDYGTGMTTRDMNYLAGTMGYMPPEYITEGILSTKYDVYSFGVILIEIIYGMCGLEPVRHQVSIEWAWEVRGVGAMKNLFVQPLCDESDHKQITRCLDVGLLCTQLKPADRLTMADVLEMLNGKNELPIPKKPWYNKRKGALPGAEKVRNIARSIPRNVRL